MLQTKQNVDTIQNTDTLNLDAWKKYQVTDQNRIHFKTLEGVDYIITAATKTGVTLACFVTKQENKGVK